MDTLDEARIDVVVATDTAYALPTAVTLRSLAACTTGPIRVTVLHEAVPRDVRARIEQSIGSSQVAVVWIDLGRRDLGIDVSASHLPRAACFRLRIGSLLDDDVRRCLYLDVDLLIETSLRPLWDSDLGGRTAAAVRSVNFPNIATRGAFDRWRTLGLDPRQPYFNSGVVLLDVERWRQLGLEEKAVAHLSSHERSGPNLDQNAWNYVLHKDWLELDPKWNQQTPFLDDQHGVHLVYDDETIDRVRQEPAVVHFLDRPKPWQHACTHPAAPRWTEVAARTGFGPPDPAVPTLADELRRRVRRAGGVILKGK
jgi:lipopolysaccharide biosynthesis glycosyltransferase